MTTETNSFTEFARNHQVDSEYNISDAEAERIWDRAMKKSRNGAVADSTFEHIWENENWWVD